MRIGRTIPPASAPIGLRDILNGLKGLRRGPKEVERFCSELKDYFGVRHCFLVSSGKAALTLILEALHDLQPDRDEVLIPAFCCYSVPSAIVRAGLRIRLCDSDPDTLDFDFRQLNHRFPSGTEQIGASGQRSDKRLLAALSVHLFGRAADTDRLRGLLTDPSVAVIEDAAQALGAEAFRGKLGLGGDVGFFSLGRGKVLSAVEGGIIVTGRNDLAERIRKRLESMADYSSLELGLLVAQGLALILFQRPSFFWLPKLLPFLRLGDTIYNPRFRMRKISAFQAGMTREWLAKLVKYRRLRRQSAERWSRLDLPVGATRYGDLDEPPADFIRYPLRLSPPGLWSEILRQSQIRGSGVMLTYPDAVCGIPELKSHLGGQECPAARGLSRELLTLPVHPLLSERDKDCIAFLLESAGQSPRSHCRKPTDGTARRGALE
jgi:dTDP-4-amino-4,6-dideoxygalactose transaminase